MNANPQGSGLAGFMRALAAGLQWRLLLIWLLLMLLPAWIASWPMGAMLGSALDHSAHAKAWAEAFNGLAMGDLMVQLGRTGMPAIGAAAMAGGLVTLLLTPFLTGMVVASARSPSRLGFGELMHGGLHQYWRMVRVWLWTLPFWAVAFGIAAGAMHLADEHADKAVLQSDADLWHHGAMIVAIVVLVIAHAIAESTRARFGADPKLGSATRALGRGLKMVFGRPLASFGVYLITTLIGVALVLAFGMLRMRTPALGSSGVLLAFALTQLVVLSLAWMRTARIHGLARLAPRRRRSSLDGLQAAPSLG